MNNKQTESVEQQIGKLFKEKKITVACAESCTGGLVTGRLTEVSGSSEYVMGSVVSYTNDVKAAVLGVSREALDTYGAVSELVAGQMASGVRKLIETDFGVSVTGIAGPDGGSAEKPVGLVYIGISGPGGTVVEKNIFKGNRSEIRESAVIKALSLLLQKAEQL